MRDGPWAVAVGSDGQHANALIDVRLNGAGRHRVVDRVVDVRVSDPMAAGAGPDPHDKSSSQRWRPASDPTERQRTPDNALRTARRRLPRVGLVGAAAVPDGDQAHGAVVSEFRAVRVSKTRATTSDRGRRARHGPRRARRPRPRPGRRGPGGSPRGSVTVRQLGALAVRPMSSCRARMLRHRSSKRRRGSASPPVSATSRGQRRHERSLQRHPRRVRG
jgi:hypothetical protein